MTDPYPAPSRPAPPRSAARGPSPDGPVPDPAAPARRPGTVRAVAVLAFVQAGFSFFGGLTCFQGSSGLAGLGLGRTSLGDTLTVLGLFAFLTGGLLVAGGLTVLRGRGVLVAAACALSIAVSLYWILEFGSVSKLQMTAVMMAVLPVVALVLMLGTPARGWLRFDLPALSRPAAPTPTPTPGSTEQVGAAPASAGWRADPSGRHQLRYFDGRAWTTHVADGGATGSDAL